MTAIFEVPDDASMSAVALAVGATGNIRSQTLRAYTREAMEAVLKKLP